jgi:hypothetical protein
MTQTTNYRVRFCENNYVSLDSMIAYSSQKSGFPASNILNINRSQKWVSNRNFTIGPNNKFIYINDGSDIDVELTEGNYQVDDLLLHIINRLNTLSNNWSGIYYYSTGIFNLSNTGTVTMRFSEQTSSTWNTLGYLLTTDQSGISFDSQAPRIHSEEFFIFDFGVSRPVDFVALIGPATRGLGLSMNATITLEASNLSFFSSPALSVTVPIEGNGAFRFLDDVYSTYRYWKIKIEDPMNTTGEVSFSNLYLGDYETVEQTNISFGIEENEVDLTTQTVAESGRVFFDIGNRYTSFNNLSIGIMDLEEKEKIMRMWKKNGAAMPFYISLDPKEQITNDLGSLTRFVYFSGQPIFNHIIYKLWSASFALREVV